MAKKMVSKSDRASKRVPESSGKEGQIHFTTGIRAEVKEIVGRVGSKGVITQVMAQVLDGRDQNKSIRRNVKGPVRIGDTLMLLETEIEAQRLGGGRRGKKK